jgi:hypothetical protein
VEICIKYGGQLHCHYVPELLVPVKWHGPTPGPIDYPPFLSDAMLWNAVRGLIGNISDDKVRGALESGLSSSLKAMQRRAGPDVEIRVGEAQG